MTIRNMHDAVQIIGRAVGIADLAPNAGGAFELVFMDQLPTYFQVIGETEIEIQLRLGEEGERLTDALLEAMLAANLDLRHGRLALEPGSDRVVYCGRVNIEHFDAKSLMPAVAAVIREGAAWRLEEFARLVKAVAAGQSTAGALSESFIRV